MERKQRFVTQVRIGTSEHAAPARGGEPGIALVSNFGTNAMLRVSMAVARAAALNQGSPLYAYLGGNSATRFPVPMMKILNGGKHAANSVDSQEFIVFPTGAPSFAEALRAGAETFDALAGLLRKRGYFTSVGDEGGFAPDLKSDQEACEVIVEAIGVVGSSRRRGRVPGARPGGIVVL